MNKAICIKKYTIFFERHKLYDYKKEAQWVIDNNNDILLAEYYIKLPRIDLRQPPPSRIKRIQFMADFMLVSISYKAFKYHFREFL